MERYQQAADDYITRRELDEYNASTRVDDGEPPAVPPRNSSSSFGSNLSSSSRRSVGSSRSSKSSVHGLRNSVSQQHSSSSDEDLSFTEYLGKQGLTEQTIRVLQEEEITNYHTLKTLTEEDINGLGLKVGQRAIIRSLTDRSKPPESRSHVRVSEIEESDEVQLQCYCLEEEGRGKIVAEITTQHTNAINPIKARILLLVDTSGSMGIRTGRRRKYSKLYRIKGFAKNMISSLDDGDFAGLVTFGEHANVLLPMTEVTIESRDKLKAKLDSLDKSFLSTKTNLSAGLSKALDVFRDASSAKGDLLGYRNAIIVFSDGEVNAGTQDPNKLVHEVREKIRQLSFGLEESLNQWASISTVVLGKTASELMFCLSKFCSSDAFYTIDMDVDKENTEIDIFLPVLMRKAAVAWNVSVNIESINGAIIKNEGCTQDNKVRTKSLSQSGRGPRTIKAYFYYDIPAASTKHIGIALDLDDATEEEVLKIKVEYSGFSGVRKTITTVITKSEILNQDGGKIGKALAENYKNDARMISEEMLNKAAKNIKSGNTDQSANAIEEGKSSLQKLLNKYGQMASQEETAKTEIFDYAKSLMTNMESLLQCVKTTDEDDDGEQADSSWLKIKAVSSAISREAPTLSETVTNGDVLCPLPDVQSVSSAPMRGQMERVYREQGVRESTFFDFDGAIAELKASIKIND